MKQTTQKNRKAVTQTNPEQEQLRRLQNELAKQQKRHARVIERHEAIKKRLEEDYDASSSLVTDVEWEIVCLHLQQWQLTKQPDWSILLNTQSSGYYYEPLVQLIRLLHPNFFLGGGNPYTNQYTIWFSVYDTVETDNSMPDIDSLAEAIQVLLPYLNSSEQLDSIRKLPIAGTVGFAITHPQSADYHIELAIHPSTGQAIVCKFIYQHMVESYEFPDIRAGLIHIKANYASVEFIDENVVSDDGNVLGYQPVAIGQ